MNKEGNHQYLPISDKFTNSLHKNKFKYIINDLNCIKPDEYIKIKFVRNPYQRLVSLFIHICNHHLNYSFFKFLKFVDNLHNEFKNFKYNSTQYNILTKNIISKFYEHIKNNNCFNKIINSYVIYEMFFLQLNNDEINYDYIVKIENLERDMITIIKRHNLDINSNLVSKKLNIRAHKVKIYNKNIDYSTQPLSYFKNSIPNDYQLFYKNEECKKITNLIFNEDLIKYDYTIQ